MNTFEKVYKIVSKIPKGKVTTYGAIANKIGANPRVIGFALHANKNTNLVPCHRVINSKGMISGGYAFGGPKEQKKLLTKEKVNFNEKDEVDLQKYGYFLF
jgi:methylated-DNA-protein-cysteine methyltransferase related protein